MVELKQVSFTPDVLARVAPDVSLQRHLSIGIRPNLRNFTEFKAVEFGNGLQLQRHENNVFASSIVKSGSTTVITTISLGIVEDLGNRHNQRTQHFASVYPQVEILRGRSGAPTDEEMIISQDLFETFGHCKIIPQESLNIDNIGILIKDEETGKEEILYPDLNESQWQYVNLSSMHNKPFQFVLLASTKVYSREVSTNSIFDLCFASILKALKDLKLPRCYVNDSITTKISIRSRKSNARGLVDTSTGVLNLDLRQGSQYKLELNAKPDTISSNFGVIKLEKRNKSEGEEHEQEQDGDIFVDSNEEDEPILLTDLEGEAEESTILSRISVVNNSDSINKISLVSNGDITLETLRRALEISKQRASMYS
ncbi:hypothetical protein KGF57_003365 [Candida theae]|uniref:Ribosomal RNA-processing protein 43 n=1 Tax=Candida theae TaxID=1198502 RepID=A0AAD5BD80_9ASCO|nr:uncharacterized protein KGF57_003365 [Candida theae]KAI5957056.1 hypothetical protein KGF57_003365 [Candida theae]